MSIQKYDYSGVLAATDIEEWVSYNDHIAEVERVRGEVIRENDDWILMPTLALDQIKQHIAETMRAACIEAVYAVYHENPCTCLACETLARVYLALREVQP